MRTRTSRSGRPLTLRGRSATTAPSSTFMLKPGFVTHLQVCPTLRLTCEPALYASHAPDHLVQSLVRRLYLSPTSTSSETPTCFA